MVNEIADAEQKLKSAQDDYIRALQGQRSGRNVVYWTHRIEEAMRTIERLAAELSRVRGF